MYTLGETLVAIVAILTACVMFVVLAKYGAQAVRAIFGSNEADSSSLTTSELETMVRRAVREETKALLEQTRSLQEDVERLERKVDEKVEPKRIEPPDDPHDFGLLADAERAKEQDRT